MTAVIRTDALTKHYGRVHALDGLDLTVGLARPTSGSATVLGGDPWTCGRTCPEARRSTSSAACARAAAGRI